MGKPILMGRKTHESIGRPLPGRTNIVLSRQPGYEAEGCTCVGSVRQAIDAAEATGAPELMVIGGAALYAEMLPLADRILLTRVHGEFAADTFMPSFSFDAWTEIARKRHEPDESNPVPYTFLELAREDRPTR